MSLIQEALKRQQEDGGEENPESKNVPPVQEPAEQAPSPEPHEKTMENEIQEAPEPEETPAETETPPPPEQKPQKPKKTRTVVLASTIVGLILIAAAGGSYFLFFRTGDAGTNDQADTSPAEASATEKEPEATPSPPTDVDTKKPGEEKKDDLPPKTETPSGEKTVPAGEKPTKKTPGPSRPVKAPPRTPRPKPVLWPDLTLQGLLSKSGEGAALINGEVISKGEKMQGVELTAVRKNSVMLKYKGETKELKTRESTR